ncbi:MAG: Plug domain-containing protein [Bacteroidales bacterium]|nr:Plug domain-containing protein [Bacteroidales bacterium]
MAAEISFVGYSTQKLEIVCNNPQIIKLEECATIEEVTIKAEYQDTKISYTRIDPGEVKAIPSLTGEKDMLKALQLTPGVNSGKEGSSGLLVRGGGTEHNLYLVDGVPLYQVYHIGGFLSTFDADAVKDVVLYKGGIFC